MESKHTNHKTKIFHDLNSSIGSFRGGVRTLKDYQADQQDCSQIIEMMDEKLSDIISAWETIKTTGNSH